MSIYVDIVKIYCKISVMLVCCKTKKLSKILSLFRIINATLEELFGLSDYALTHGLLIKIKHALNIGALCMVFEV